jgi:hypothetical protein
LFWKASVSWVFSSGESESLIATGEQGIERYQTGIIRVWP